MSRCCSVKRCGLTRLARYSRNFSSALCDTRTAGNDTARVLRRTDNDSRFSFYPVHPATPTPPVNEQGPPRRAAGLWLSFPLQPVQQPFEGRLPALGGVVGARGDLSPHAGN